MARRNADVVKLQEDLRLVSLARDEAQVRVFAMDITVKDELGTHGFVRGAQQAGRRKGHVCQASREADDTPCSRRGPCQGPGCQDAKGTGPCPCGRARAPSQGRCAAGNQIAVASPTAVPFAHARTIKSSDSGNAPIVGKLGPLPQARLTPLPAGNFQVAACRYVSSSTEPGRSHSSILIVAKQNLTRPRSTCLHHQTNCSTPRTARVLQEQVCVRWMVATAT
ncbi:hypothetical protein BCR44DRAFT_66860 [Catenaria anguillulae PL171]|uniref:Uncharacterized protein n=1 Tax=Catenaria anguillulae PL171 TaxID=765915 RepID=A0A1Y2H5B2_9FUNG|nr:hypothetical protein BCR44DRAFT_66860 [Catenaria anguillulae PL171]